MAGISLRQIEAVIAVCEEVVHPRRARENATQSGISQHIAAVERALGLRLFERSSEGRDTDLAGQRYYQRCIEAVASSKTRTRRRAALPPSSPATCGSG